MSQWKNCGVMRTVGMKRAIRLVTVAEKSMGLNEGLASTKLELRALRFVRLMCKLVGELVFIHKKEVSLNGRYTLFRCEQLYK
ncbi:hypothetical protein MM817_03294 [Acidibacillus sp. S0AB]|uniref:Uncharacterized protein n=1 Tax=Sulfoacidibacillus ferrooxidans TaxID=2005001 RepID=A0A9X1VBU4_9BACL|nr:hypothetical protein [Sulfoacidibacillus ferrooxidans]